MTQREVEALRPSNWKKKDVERRKSRLSGGWQETRQPKGITFLLEKCRSNDWFIAFSLCFFSLFPGIILFNCIKDTNICIDCDFTWSYSCLSRSGSSGKLSSQSRFVILHCQENWKWSAIETYRNSASVHLDISTMAELLCTDNRDDGSEEAKRKTFSGSRAHEILPRREKFSSWWRMKTWIRQQNISLLYSYAKPQPDCIIMKIFFVSTTFS